MWTIILSSRLQPAVTGHGSTSHSLENRDLVRGHFPRGPEHSHPPAARSLPTPRQRAPAKTPPVRSATTCHPPAFSGHEEEVRVNTSLFGKRRESARASKGQLCLTRAAAHARRPARRGSGPARLRSPPGSPPPRVWPRRAVTVLPMPRFRRTTPGARSPAPPPSSSPLQGKTSRRQRGRPAAPGRSPPAACACRRGQGCEERTGRGRITRNAETKRGF